MSTIADNAAPPPPEGPTGYTYHPAANIFPLMIGAEFDDLVTDIKANGQRETIKRLDGKIIDGRNRLRTCIAAGMVPVIEDIKLATSPTEYVVSLNLRRRHLTPAQKAALAVEIADHLAVEAKQKQHAAGVHGEEGGRGKKASGTLGDESSPVAAAKKKEEAKSVTKAARAAGAGITATKKLAAIKKKAPGVFAQAKAGKMSVAQAERAVNRAEGKAVARPVKLTPASTTKIVAEAHPVTAASDTEPKASFDQQYQAVTKTVRLPRDGSVVDGCRVACVTDDEVVVEIAQPHGPPGVDVKEAPVVSRAVGSTEGQGDRAAANPRQMPEAARMTESDQPVGSAHEKPAFESSGSFPSVATLVNIDEIAVQTVAEVQARVSTKEANIQTELRGTTAPTSGAGARGSNLPDQEVTTLRNQVLAHLKKKGLMKRTLVDTGVFESVAGLSRFLNGKKGLSRSRATAIEAFLAGSRT